MNKDRTALLVAVIALVALAIAIAYLASPAVLGANDVRWARLQYLFGAIQAVAFAGAGWLWGREVHREQAERATAAVQAAEGALRRADRAEGELRSFAQIVLAHANAIRQAHAGSDDLLAASRAAGVSTPLDALAELAKRYV